MDGVELEFTDDALEAVADQAILRGTGARGLRAIMEEVLLPVMYDIPSRDDVAKVVVTEQTVREQRQPDDRAAHPGPPRASRAVRLSRPAPATAASADRRRVPVRSAVASACGSRRSTVACFRLRRCRPDLAFAPLSSDDAGSGMAAGFLQRERIVAPPGWSRWLIPPAALSIHLAIGQAYAWSVFKPPLEAGLGISGVASALPFTLGHHHARAVRRGVRDEGRRQRPALGDGGVLVLLRGRLPDLRARALPRPVLAGRGRLRVRRRHRAGHRLHLAGLHADQVVPGPAGAVHRHRDHGLRRRRADRLAADQPAAHRVRRHRRRTRT